ALARFRATPGKALVSRPESERGRGLVHRGPANIPDGSDTSQRVFSGLLTSAPSARGRATRDGYYRTWAPDGGCLLKRRASSSRTIVMSHLSSTIRLRLRSDQPCRWNRFFTIGIWPRIGTQARSSCSRKF